MSLFLDNGFVNMPRLFASRLPFIFVVGGRGTGKTYGALEYVRKQALEGKKFIYMRRTQDQVDKISQDDFSPFKSIDELTGTITTVQKMAGKTFSFIDAPSDKTLGYCFALSTFAKMRGFDASDVSTLVFDEFIPEKHERPIKNEAEAFFNAVETINRNRELTGGEPLQCVLLSNANNMGNPLFLELGLVSRATKMLSKGVDTYRDEKRGLMLVIIQNSPISEAKKQTALYKLTAGSSFQKMAIDNDFDEQCSNLRHAPLKELRPLVGVGEITIYTHKSENWLYVSTHRTGSPPTFGSSAADLNRFRLQYMWVWEAYMMRRVYFEEYLCELLLSKYLRR